MPLKYSTSSVMYLLPDRVLPRLIMVLFPCTSPLGCKDRLWKSEEDMSLLEHPKLIQVAQKYDKTVAQLLLKWQVSYYLLKVWAKIRKKGKLTEAEIFL